VADAYLDRAPLVAITGQAGLEKTHKEAHQYINAVHVFEHVTNWSTTITRADFIPEIVKKAFEIAVDAPGAVHLELPEDVAEEDTQENPIKRKKHIHISAADEADIKKAVQNMKGSKNPIILAGNGIIRGSASEELKKLVEKTGIPVVTTFMGKGAIPADDKLNLGSIGLQSKDFILCGLDNADLVITIGFDPVEYSPRFWNSESNKRIVHIHSNHPEVDASYVPEVSLIGDIQETLVHLTPECNFRKKVPDYFKKLKRMLEAELDSYKNDSAYPMKPQKIIYDIRSCLSRSDILISDVGAHKLWIGRLYPAFEPNTVLISNGFASMGFALPGALSVKLVHPGKKLVVATGDGGFLMNIQELETARRLKSDFVVIVFNDSKYGVIEWKEMMRFNKSFGVDFSNPDFKRLAESFGANGVKIENAAELAPQLKKALSQGGVWVFDVEVDYSENMRLTERFGTNVCRF
jgi:acetolactate synthase-1/2/3 large subunit